MVTGLHAVERSALVKTLLLSHSTVIIKKKKKKKKKKKNNKNNNNNNNDRQSRDGNGSVGHDHGSNGSPFLDGSHRSSLIASDLLTHDDEISAQ